MSSKRCHDREPRDGIDALLRIGIIHKAGRRYLPISTRRPPAPGRQS